MNTLYRFCEQKADLEACKYTTDKEKLAIICQWEIYLEDSLKLRKKVENDPGKESNPNYYNVDSKGNYLIDSRHPPLTTRIQKIKSTMIESPRNINPRECLHNFHLVESVTAT